MSAISIMPYVAFDTLAYANKLKAAGLDPKIAEAQTELQATVLSDLTTNQLATKKDLQKLEHSLKIQINALETRINTINNKTDKLKNDLLIRLGSITIGCTAVLGTLLTLVKIH